MAWFSRGSQAYGDYDNDGDLDLLLTGLSGALNTSTTHLYRNEGGSFTLTDAGLAGFSFSSTAFGDYDNDGDLDILLTGYSTTNGRETTTTHLYGNQGGSFTRISAGLPGVSSGAGIFGDYDNDGDLDILITGGNGSESTPITHLYRNEKGSFTRINTRLTGLSDGSGTFADYDNDGDLDLLLTGLASGDDEAQTPVTRLYRNEGGSFSDTNAGLEALHGGSAAFGDYDNDGDPDLVLTGLGPDNAPATRLYRNENGTFTDTNAQLAAVYLGSAAFGDHDNDGDLDILLTGATGRDSFTTRLYRNENGTFADADAPLQALYGGEGTFGDYDKDGDLDLLLTGVGPGNAPATRLYRNDAATPNTLPSVPSGLSAAVAAGQVTLSWNAATDAQTPPAGLNYNLYVGTSPKGVQQVTPQSDPTSGYRRVVQAGNGQAGTTFQLNDLPAGTYYWSVQAVDAAFAGSPFAAEGSFVIRVDNQPPQVSSSPSTQQVQYSDPILPVTVSATDADNTPGQLSITTAWKRSSDAAFAPGLPAGLSLAGPTEGGNIRSWTLTGKVLPAPGTYTIRFTANDGTPDATNNQGFTEVELVVRPEHAVATYTGSSFAATAGPKSATATVLLSATVQDISALPLNAAYDTYPGDIKKATLTFRIMETGQEIIAPIGYVNAADQTTGTAVASFTANLSGDDSQSYTVRIKVGGYYLGCEYGVVTVSKPVAGLVSGGGFLVLAQSAGEKAGDPGSKNQFGLSVKNGKNGMQGRINVLVRRTEADGLLHTYQLKGNVMSLLAVQGNQASFEGKASIRDVTNPDHVLPVDGNAALRVQLSDNGEPGSSDQLAITLFDKNGGLWFASRWDGSKTVPQTLAGGNLKISGGLPATRPGGKNARESFVGQGEEAASVRAYPNPASGKVNVSLGNYAARAIKATWVIDAAGNTRLRNAHRVTGENTLEVDLGGLKAGLHLLQLQGEGFSGMIKFVKE